ncbi:hypothetical protein BHE74_00058161 [Ensete ventricosum]|nr:hypothetical protein GW17_00005504 [Ensete ventricosum]RWW36788.1 hypothetical protein BHE74_00058161 [Ensete ventricosum]
MPPHVSPLSELDDVFKDIIDNDLEDINYKRSYVPDITIEEVALLLNDDDPWHNAPTTKECDSKEREEQKGEPSSMTPHVSSLSELDDVFKDIINDDLEDVNYKRSYVPDITIEEVALLLNDDDLRHNALTTKEGDSKEQEEEKGEPYEDSTRRRLPGRRSTKQFFAKRSWSVHPPTRFFKTKKTCIRCGASQTPKWRKGPTGRMTLCNACGIRFGCDRLRH